MQRLAADLKIPPPDLFADASERIERACDLQAATNLVCEAEIGKLTFSTKAKLKLSPLGSAPPGYNMSVML